MTNRLNRAVPDDALEKLLDASNSEVVRGFLTNAEQTITTLRLNVQTAARAMMRDPIFAYAVAERLFRSVIASLSEMTENCADHELPPSIQQILNGYAELRSTLQLNIRALNLTRHVEDRLLRAGLCTVGELVKKTPDELRAIPRFGMDSINRVQSALRARGLELGIDPDAPDILAQNIQILDLSIRCRNAMLGLGVITVRQLLEHSGRELLRLKNFGKTSLTEVRQKLAALGLTLKDG